MTVDPYERAWRFIEVNDRGCWIWTGGTSGSKGARPGFSPEKVDGRWLKRYVHIWMWERENGPVPDGLELDHAVCQNRMCVNPAHLEAVTPEENARRTRKPCPEGHDEWTFDAKGRRRGCKACNRMKARARMHELYHRRKAMAA